MTRLRLAFFVLGACFVAAPVAAQQLGTQLSLPAVSQGGVFDPSLADTEPGQRAWMSYSAVDPSPRWPDQNKRAVTTRLAYSNDAGGKWTDIGYPINDMRDIPSGSKGGTWVSEVSSLVLDPYAPPQERWKLFWHHYLQVNGGGQFQNGWIGYKAAATPQALRLATEIKLFGAWAYDAVNDDPESKTFPPVGGPPVIELQKLHTDLGMCVAFTEPGVMATQSGLYMSLVCMEPRVRNVIGLLGMGLFGAKGRVIMLKCNAPCQPASPNGWRYIATILTDDNAKSIGFRGYSAPDLFMQNGKAYLMVTRMADKPWKNAYDGCDIYRFADLEKATLEQNHGKLWSVGKVRGLTGTFNGACTYQPAVTASGFMYNQLDILGRTPKFEIFQTGTDLQPLLPDER